jgi:hypothetical protein
MRFRKPLTLLMLAMGLVFALSAWAQQKPFTRDQVQGLVRDGLGDDSGAKLIAGGGDIVLPCRRLGGPSVARRVAHTSRRSLPGCMRPCDAHTPKSGTSARCAVRSQGAHTSRQEAS